MKFGILGLIFVFVMAGNLTANSSPVSDSTEFRIEKNFNDLTQAEHTAAKRTALTQKVRPLVACADPGNMPLSNKNAEGIENRIAKQVADAMGTTISFFWRPYIDRGLTRETFDNRECDLLLGMPYEYPDILTTVPIYRSSYVFAYREDSNINIRDLDDPVLHKLDIGTYQHSALRSALVRRNIRGIDLHTVSHNSDLVPENQPIQQVRRMINHELDIVGVWGPFAGYLKAKESAPIILQPVNMMEDVIPLEFSLAIGMRPNDVVLKYAMDEALKTMEKEIEALLEEFGVPLVECSQCIVQGKLPSHGSYYETFLEMSQRRFIEPPDRETSNLDVTTASADQIMTLERLERWLNQGGDLDQELANAVLAADPVRIRYLADKGADLDKLNNQGYAPLHDAARYRSSDMVTLLLELGANVNLRDRNGWTPLMHAAFRNHVPSVEQLVLAGAEIEARTPEGYTALTIATGERSFFSAKALLEIGADVNNPMAGNQRITPLMLVAMHRPTTVRELLLAEGMEPLDLARMMIDQGADVNAVTQNEQTAMMVAASYDNSPIIGLLYQNGADIQARDASGKSALDYALESRSANAAQSLELFESFSSTTNND